MKRASGHLLVLLIPVVGFGSTAFCQDSPPISFSTNPAVPVAGQPFSITATFLGGTPAGAFDYFDMWDDGAGHKTIVISGGPDFPYQLGTETVEVPGQRPGTYSVLFTSVGFSPRPAYAFFQITVAAAPVQLSTLSSSALGLLVVLILLTVHFNWSARAFQAAIRYS